MSNARLKRKLRSLERRGLIPAWGEAIPTPKRRLGLWGLLLASFKRLLGKPDPMPESAPRRNLRPLEARDPRRRADLAPGRSRIKR